ncbi:MAG: coproporphyrinogen III oxidase family protein [Wolinella sp.]
MKRLEAESMGGGDSLRVATNDFKGLSAIKGGNLAHYVANKVMRRASSKYLSLQPLAQDKLPAPKAGRSYLLYAHVPFCATLCTYCSFNRFLFDEAKARRYFRSLREEMKMAHDLGYRFDSMYVGGGTTSILLDELCESVALARKLFPIREVSCESDPNSIDKETIGNLKGLVDRFSVGVQSFDDDILRRTGRYEKFGGGAETIKKLEALIGKLPVINVDLIFNFPTQNEAMLRRDLAIIKELSPTQVTTYPLMSSPSVKSLIKRAIGEVSLEKEAILYRVILEELLDSYTQISSWAFSKKGDDIIDEYVVNHDEYVGIGSGSFSFLDGVLYVNTFSLKEYSQRVSAGKMGLVRFRKYTKLSQMQYRLMVGLFGGGVHKGAFSRAFGIPIEIALFKELAFLRLFGMIEESKGIIRPTFKGKYLFLSMMKEFYIGMDTVREESRARLSTEDM